MHTSIWECGSQQTVFIINSASPAQQREESYICITKITCKVKVTSYHHCTEVIDVMILPISCGCEISGLMQCVGSMSQCICYEKCYDHSTGYRTIRVCVLWLYLQSLWVFINMGFLPFTTTLVNLSIGWTLLQRISLVLVMFLYSDIVRSGDVFVS